MKPCARNKKLIAWLALNELDAKRAAALREHLENCESCRRYREEIAHVTEALSRGIAEDEKCTDASAYNFEPSESFHRRLAGKLQVIESSSVLENLGAWLSRWRINWRLALPAMAVLVIALWMMTLRHSTLSPPAQATAQGGARWDSASDLPPTIANYQMVAIQSLDKFDDLLTRQGNKTLPAAPAYTASSLSLAAASF